MSTSADHNEEITDPKAFVVQPLHRPRPLNSTTWRKFSAYLEELANDNVSLSSKEYIEKRKKDGFPERDAILVERASRELFVPLIGCKKSLFRMKGPKKTRAKRKQELQDVLRNIPDYTLYVKPVSLLSESNPAYGETQIQAESNDPAASSQGGENVSFGCLSAIKVW